MSLAALLGAPPPCAFDDTRACNGYCAALMRGHFGADLANEAIATVMWRHGTQAVLGLAAHCSMPYTGDADDADAGHGPPDLPSPPSR